MRLILARHGEANRPEVDPGKNLSEAGRAGVESVARFLGNMGSLRVARVLHSGKARAAQTAEILAATLAPGVSLEENKALAPNDPVQPLVADVASWDQDTLIAGHLPFLGRFLSSLVVGNEETDVVRFAAATVVCLEKIEGRWVIEWVVGPGILAGTL